MIKNDYTLEPQVSDEVAGSIIGKGIRDVIVLRYMAQKIRMVLHGIEQPVAALSPLSYSLEVRHHRRQRVILYDPAFLLRNTALSFVGFVSGKQKTVDPSIENEMQRVDALLTKELVHAPSLLCYSSLELGPGKWYNLVLLTNFNIKTHLQNSSTHCYGAYQLAARYYEWIRLHSGIITDGLCTSTLLVQKTKYYTCQAPEPHFTVRELTYV
jgi:hypothetical protein